jgi:hypothetical protein
VTLGEVLGKVCEFPWDQAIYLPADEVWELSTRCTVADPDDCEDGRHQMGGTFDWGKVTNLGCQALVRGGRIMRAFGRRSGSPRASNRALVRSADAFQDLGRAPGIGQWASRTHLDPGVRSVRQGRARSEG